MKEITLEEAIKHLKEWGNNVEHFVDAHFQQSLGGHNEYNDNSWDLANYHSKCKEIIINALIQNGQLDLLVKPTVAEFNTGWIKAENELPQYYRLIVGRFTDGCELVWRAKDDDMQDIYTVYNTDKILTNLIDWIPMRKKEIKIGSV